MKLLKKDFYKVLLVVIIISSLPITFLYIYLNTSNTIELEIIDNADGKTKTLDFCSSYSNLSYSIKDNSQVDIEKLSKDIYLYPEVENLNCLGKIVEVWGSESENSYVLLYGTNNKIYKIINLIGNIFYLSILILFTLKDKRSLYALSSIFALFNFNLFLRLIFINEFTLQNIIFDFNNLIMFLSPLFLLTPMVSKKNIHIIIALYFYSIFNYEYLGVFAILIFIFRGFNFDFSKKEKNLIYLLPVTFLILRYVTAFSSNFNFLWSKLFQKTYFGYTRYFDLQGDMLLLKCNSGADISYLLRFQNLFINCPELKGYGPIRKILPIYSEVWTTTLILMGILLLFIYIQYRDVLINNDKNLLIISLIFISPPLNLVIHLGNPDIFYLAFLYFFIKRYKNYPIAASFIIYLFTLWKIHALAILIGFFFYSIVINQSRVTKINFFFIILTITTYLIDLKYSEPILIPGSPDERIGFGIMHDAIQLTKFIDYRNQNFVYLFYVLISLLVLVMSIIFIRKFSNQENNLINSYEIYGLSFWFFLCMIYENQTYRLSLFLVLLFYIYKHGNTQIKYFVILAVFLNPVFTSDYLIFEKITLVLNRVGIYIIFSYLLSLITYDMYNKIIKKLMTNLTWVK